MSERPRVVIVGGGFGGVSAARGLARAPVDVTLVDRNNHHVFQPLLYQVATAHLAPGDIAAPIRQLLGGQRNTSVFLGEVTGVDAATRTVRFAAGGEASEARELAYDFLVVATGVAPSYFGHDDFERHAPGLKTLAERDRAARPHARRFRARRARARRGAPERAAHLRAGRRRAHRRRDGRARWPSSRARRWPTSSAASIRAPRASCCSKPVRASCRRSTPRSPSVPAAGSPRWASRCASASRSPPSTRTVSRSADCASPPPTFSGPPE
jgi:glycine/D-amino acid oxidase-like deaminating enzyme